MARRGSTRKIKKHRLYTYEQAGEALGRKPGTIRSWRGRGLAVLANSKPHYILGEALIDFVAAKKAARSSEKRLDQMRCFKCQAQKRPLGAMVDYVPLPNGQGQLVGLCEDCEGGIYLFVSRAGLAKYDGIFDIVIKERA